LADAQERYERERKQTSDLQSKLKELHAVMDAHAQTIKDKDSHIAAILAQVPRNAVRRGGLRDRVWRGRHKGDKEKERLEHQISVLSDQLGDANRRVTGRG
jgi:DNA-binding winged helix-turn-helix (wHTH) protein